MGKKYLVSIGDALWRGGSDSRVGYHWSLHSSHRLGARYYRESGAAQEEVHKLNRNCEQRDRGTHRELEIAKEHAETADRLKSASWPPVARTAHPAHSIIGLRHPAHG